MVPIAAHDYQSLMGALRARKDALGLTNLELDDLGGMPSGYSSKLFCGQKSLGYQSIGKLLCALQLVLIVAPAGAEQAPRLHTDNGEQIRARAWSEHQKIRRAQNRKNAMIGYHLRTARQRAEFHRRGAIAAAQARKRKRDAERKREMEPK